MRALLILCLALSAGGQALAQDAWKVDPAKQRQLDAGRKAILEDELAAEAKLFIEAHAVRSAERMDRHRRNLAALTRELAHGETEAERAPLKGPARGRPEWVISP